MGSPVGAYGATWTSDSGTFSFEIDVPWGWYEGVSGLAYGSRTPPPYHGVGCVIVHAPAHDLVVASAESGEWSLGHDGVVLKMGDIRLDKPD